MTPRKELFIKTKQALGNIPELEYIDLNRNQFSSENYPDTFICALIKINAIDWESMTEQKQEGKATIDVTLHCRDGWMDQHNGTNDPEHGLNEIDLIDNITEELQFLQGDFFRELQLSDEDSEEQDMRGMFSYRMRFECNIYRRIKPKHNYKTITKIQ